MIPVSGCSDQDIVSLRILIRSCAQELDGIDFEEQIQIPQVRASLRVWKEAGRLHAFTYVDGYNNLWFDVFNSGRVSLLADEVIDWGCQVMRQRNIVSNSSDTLDCSCRSDQSWRIELLLAHGFVQQSERTIKYVLSLSSTPIVCTLPSGFVVRRVSDQDRIEDLVALHRAAFSTDHMTIEERLSMMNSPQYVRELDLLAIAPNGQLAAFCLAGFKDEKTGVAYTDPIGTHPHYRRLGLARALVLKAMFLLSSRGARMVEFSTSSENVGTNGLAQALGFLPVSEKIWFSKVIT